MRCPSLRHLLPLLLLVTACAHAPTPPLAKLEDAARAGPGANARSRALAGFHALFVTGEAAQATERFQSALLADPDEPFAHLGHLLLAERSARLDQQFAAALALVQRSPQHPISAVGARKLLELTGQVPSWDAQLLETLPAVLARRPGVEATVLLQTALSQIHKGRHATGPLAETLGALGVAREFTVLGPLSAFTWLDTEAGASAVRTGALGGPFNGPHGTVKPRQLSFPDGQFGLSDEAAAGDVYLVAVDAELAQGGLWAVRVASAAAWSLWVDGTEVASRHPERRASSAVATAGIRLEPGRHRLLLRLSRDARSGGVILSLLPAEGQQATAKLTAATGDAPRWSGVELAPLRDSYPTADALREALQPEAGEALARLVAAYDGLGRDSDGAQAQLAPLAGLIDAPSFLVLRAEAALRDRTIPSKVGQGRATRDLERALSRDPGATWARLRLATLMLEQERPAEAGKLLEPARAAVDGGGATTEGGGPLVLLALARVASTLGVEAQAEALANEALERLPGLCPAELLRYHLARKRDAIANADALLAGPLATCPGNLSRLAEHARARGRTEEAAKALEALAALDPTSLSTAFERVRMLEALGRHEEASRLLASFRPVWPHNALLLERLADVKERGGQREQALVLREEALLLDGGNLTLRRNVERARTGRELLEEEALDAREVLRAYEAAPGEQSTSTALVLDAAAVRVYPDGSQVSRIHTLQKVLGQSGVSEAGEVTLPAGAQVLALRTLKADGRVLEPEDIEGKETVSLPGVEVGDSVDVEYLLPEGARDPSLPGFSAASFYFQLVGQPNHRSTYVVKSPASVGLEVEARHLEPAPVKREGELLVFRHEERRVPPRLPEPNAPPAASEYLPYVQVGAGTLGQEALVRRYADAFLDRGALTAEVERFAREAAGELKGLEAVRAVHAAVSRKLTGSDAGLGLSASASLAQDRGSRLWATKAALQALGIDSRLVAVRTFGSDPVPSRFPSPGDLGYVGLRVDLPGQPPAWVDTAVRYSPFGELPEQASGMQAWVLPEPGKPLETVTTPAPTSAVGKRIELDLKLSADGELSGKGVETYVGYEGARLSAALADMPADRRRQGVEQALSRYFGGMKVDALDITLVETPGAPLTLRYAFTASRAARVEGDSLALSALTFPAQLGRRLVTVGKRSTPLFIGESESSLTRVKLELPEGFAAPRVVPPVEEKSAFGRYARKEQLEGRTLRIEEELRLERARIAPKAYGDFGAWAGSVDLIQSRDFVLRRAAPVSAVAR